MKFEWDENKEQINILKHGIDFATAALVFGDDRRLEFYDERHSIYEDRFCTIGMIQHTIVVLYVVYTERKDAIRIISARCATKREEEVYHENNEY